MGFGTFAQLIIWMFILAPLARAADVPQSFTLDGKLFSDAAGTTPLQDPTIAFTIQILDDSKTCVIYEESQSVSTAASKGYFSVQVGSETGSLVRTAGDSANAMAHVFQNISLINGKLASNGAPCTVPPVAAQRRYVRIKILPASLGGAARTLSPDLTIDSVPNAVVAERAETLQGLRANNVLQVNTTGTNQLSQANLESLFTSTTRFNSLTSVVDGTSSSYMRTNSPSGAQLPVMAGAPSSPTPGSVWFDSSDSKLKYQTSVGPVIVGSGSGTVSSVGFTAPSELSVTGAPITTSGTIAVTWATQTTNKVFAAPDGSTGTPTFRVMTANDIPNLPWTKITSLLPTTLLGYGITDAVKNNGGTPSLESGLDAAKGAATTAGRVWISTDTKQIYRDNGTTWDLIGSGAAGGGTVTNVTSANSYLSVANGTTTPALTLNVGTAANTVAAGNDSRITGALQQATAFSGDVSGAYNATSVDKIKGTAVTITSLTSGNFLKYNGTAWVNSSLAAGDITGALTYTPVNKAGDTMTGLLVLSADPAANLGAATKQYVDSSTSTAAANYLLKDGTVALTADWDIDGAGAGTRKLTGLAAPTAGDGAATKTYADTKFITKTLPAAPTVAENGQSLRWNNGSNTWEYYTAGTGGGDFMANGSVPMTGTLKMGGNTIYGNSTSGGNLTLDSTSNSTKGNVFLAPSGGVVGIGTTSPVGALHVVTTGGSTDLMLQSSGDNDWNGNFIDFWRSRGTTGSPAANIAGDLIMGLEAQPWKGDYSYSWTQTPASIRVYAEGTISSSSIPLSIRMTTTASGSTTPVERFTILPNGNVGIGSTTPATVLDVNGATTFRGVAAASAPPTAAQGKIYYDSTANKFKVSENNGAYVDLVGGGGTVTSVSSANSYLTVTNGTTTPSLTVNVGTAANTVAAGNDSRITGALQQATAFSGDVSGAYNATSVDKIKGTAVMITSLTSGNFLKYNGTAWVNSNLAAGDITGALTYTPVNKAGDTMTGLLVLSADPSANLGASTKQYVDSAASTAQSNAQTYADTKFITKTLPAAPGAGQNGQSIRWNNGTSTWEYYTAGTGGGDFMASGSVPMTGTLKMGGNAIYGNSTSGGNLTLESTSNATKGNVIIAPTTGKVGVFTTSPRTDMQVNGILLTNRLSISDGDPTFDNTYIEAPSTNNLGFYTTNTQRVLIDDSGNVGIGTGTPVTRLDINGGQTFRGVAAATTPAVAGQGKIYFDSTANKFKVSENNGAFVDLVGGGGTVTSVSSANSYLTVTNGTTTPSLTLNVGTAANTVAAGNDSRITGALQQATAFSGDVSGAYNATSVDKIKGTAVTITSLTSGNFLKYNGTAWVNSSLAAGDITGALTYTPVNKAGDTMTGLLVLSADPSANLGASTKQYVDSAASTAQSNAQTYADTKFITKTLPAAPAAGQNGQSIRWNNGSNIWEYYTPGGSGDFMKDGSVAMTGTLKMGGNTIYGNSTVSGNLTLDSTSDATKGYINLQPGSTGNVGIGTTTPRSRLHVAADNTSSANYGVLSVGAGNFTGAGGGKFAGSASGTEIAVNAASGFAGNFLDFQVNGSSAFKVTASGGFQSYAITDWGNGNVYMSSVVSFGNRGQFMDGGLTMPMDGTITFNNNTYTHLGSNDTGMTRNAAGVIEINNGTAGTLRDVKLRALNPSGGSLGIGVTSPGAILDVTDASTTTSAIIVPRAGNFTGTAANGMIRYNTTSTLFEFRQNGAWVNYTTVSDGRLKKDVEPVANGLDIVNKLNPVFYNWDRSNPKATSFSDKHEVGFIAQEVEKVLPEVVNQGEDSYRSLEYGKMVSVAIAAIKELYRDLMGVKADQAEINRKIASLEAENAKLKKENADQAKQLDNVNARLDKIEKALGSK